MTTSSSASQSGILVTQLERVRRAFTGGLLLERWLGASDPRDGDRPEGWLVSTVPARSMDGAVDEGLSTTTLPDDSSVPVRTLVQADPHGMLGAEYVTAYGAEAGVLARIADSNVRLVLQAHPTAEKASAFLGYPHGKAEAWYILGTRSIDGESPCVYAGFREGVDREEWIDACKRGDSARLLDSLHRIPVEPGDTLFVPSGMPHAMGAGCLFFEFHEPSDVTLRLERSYRTRTFTDDEMHAGMGFDALWGCIDFHCYAEEEILARVRPPLATPARSGALTTTDLLPRAFTGTFGMELWRIDGTLSWSGDGTHRVGAVLSGEGVVRTAGTETRVRPGTGLFFPATAEACTIEGDQLALVIGLPPELPHHNTPGSKL